MFKEYEVLEVYTDKLGNVEDSDNHGIISVDDDTEEMRDNIVTELANLGISIPHSWDIVVDDYMGLIAIYDNKGKYKYQLRG